VTRAGQYGQAHLDAGNTYIGAMPVGFPVFAGVVGRLDLRIRFVQLTKHPMLVEGLVVDQSPRSPVKVHQRGELTVQVWHPPAQVTEDPPGASAAR